MVWEVVARRVKIDRLEPPLWVVAFFCGFAAFMLSSGGGFHIANGQPSSIFLIVVSGPLLVLPLWPPQTRP